MQYLFFLQETKTYVMMYVKPSLAKMPLCKEKICMKGSIFTQLSSGISLYACGFIFLIKRLGHFIKAIIERWVRFENYSTLEHINRSEIVNDKLA